MDSYYMPPPPDPESAYYQQYRYAAGFPVQHMNRSVAFDPTNENVENGANANYEEEDDMPNFDVDASSPPIPMETRHQAQAPYTTTSVQQRMDRSKVGTVYKKAPGAPKRFKSSYVHFFTHFVEKKKQQLGPDGVPIKLDISAVSKECSQAWKALPAEQRKYWNDQSEREKEEYNKQMEAYQGPLRIATSRVKRKKEGAPKRSPSAFFLFVKAKRPDIKKNYPDLANTKVVKMASEMWKELSEPGKAPFKDEEKRLRAQYHIEAEKYKKNLGEEQSKEEKEDEHHERKEEKENEHHEQKEADDAITGGETPPLEAVPHPVHGVLTNGTFMHPSGFVPPRVAAAAAASSTTSRSKKRKRDPKAPKRSPPAFFLFVNHCRPELKMQYPELRHTELVKMLGQKWADMLDEEKKPFRDHEQQLREQYHIDIERYRKGAVSEVDYWDQQHTVTMPPPVYEPNEPQLVHRPQKKYHRQPMAPYQSDCQHPVKGEEPDIHSPDM